MFTGIVEEVGSVASLVGGRLTVQASTVLDGLRVSDSILVAGVCLTVVSLDDRSFSVDIVPETRRRTTLGELQPGGGVNLERALAWGGRVGGHLVQGHVDGTGEIASTRSDGDSNIIVVNGPERIMRYVVEKGFIAVDGISLTVADRSDSSFSFTVIPFTLEHTTLKVRRPEDRVNLEADVTGKYVERLIQPYIRDRG